MIGGFEMPLKQKETVITLFVVRKRNLWYWAEQPVCKV
jgi:hypothetical protein